MKTNDAAAIYQQKAADENAATEPETWQSYDIEYQAAEYDEDGNKTENARVSLWWNDVLVHDDVEIQQGTGGNIPEGPSTGSIRLQDHGNPVRYRDIWIEPLDSGTEPDVTIDDLLAQLDQGEEDGLLTPKEARHVRSHALRAEEYLDRGQEERAVMELRRATNDTRRISHNEFRQLLERDLAYLINNPQ